MDHRQAHSLLDLNENSTEEDLKKAFKTKSLQFHPDRKDGSEEKFKEINTAYQFLQKNGIKTPVQNIPFNPFGPGFTGVRDPGGFNPFNVHFNDPFANFYTSTAKNHEELIIYLELSVLECMNGCEKELTFDRKVKCEKCNGLGFETYNQKCPHCEGNKHRKVKLGDGTEKILPCVSCRGAGYVIRRDKNCGCAHGIYIKRTTEKVTIPSGATLNAKLRVHGLGHYENMIGGNGDLVIIVAKVNPYNGIELINGNDVGSVINISLLDALKGKSIEVETLIGKKNLKIPPKTKNKDQLRSINYGIGHLGSHFFNINVTYPENVEKIIEFLEVESKEKENNGV